jgi:hypothetical protein
MVWPPLWMNLQDSGGGKEHMFRDHDRLHSRSDILWCTFGFRRSLNHDVNKTRRR